MNTAPYTLYSFPYIPIMFPIYLLYIRITLILQNLGIGHNELFCSSDESCCIYHILVFFWFLLQRYNMIANSMFVEAYLCPYRLSIIPLPCQNPTFISDLVSLDTHRLKLLFIGGSYPIFLPSSLSWLFHSTEQGGLPA